MAPGALALAAACTGPQSALDPAGRGAERVADLFWWMAGGALAIWALVVGGAWFLLRIRPEAHPRRMATLVLGGGVVFPTVVLTGLLIYGLALLPDLLAPAPEGSLRIAVSGEQWWWRVRYLPPEGAPVELANELVLPVGQRIDLLLDAPDVIHSFWIPSLGGKVDMIPGRTNRLTLEPTRTGVYRGACAEYCGGSHALMSFRAKVVEPAELEAWLAAQRLPARPPATPLARRGARVFAANGCGACHRVRGTAADGTIGPDLTHVGSRLSLGAGILPNEAEAFARWVAHTEEIKPEVNMPSYGMLPDEELRALAAYLEGLQ